jgi:two-component system, cell cycle response regulator DivK
MAELVLIVDDNEKNAKLARDVLELAGMRTLSAATAAEAVALACEQRPDIILMDLRLPDFDGAEATRLLGADERTAHIPVIALSALPADEVAPWFRDAGFVAFIEKPIDVLAFPDQVRVHFASA